MKPILPIAWWERATLSLLRRQIPKRVQKGGSLRALARALAPGVQELSYAFNHERGSLPPAYLQDKRLLSAYVGHFGLLNADRSAAVIGQAGEVLDLFRKIRRERPLELLDLGSGTGAAMAGLLEVLAPDADGLPPRAVLVDRSHPALKTAGDLLAHAPSSPKVVPIRHDLSRGLPSGPSMSRGFDVVVAANCLSELAGFPYNIRPFLQRVATLLRPGGILVLIEPGTQELSTGLMTLKESGLGWRTVAPCPHDRPCPLHVRGSKDWCHGSFPYQRSTWMTTLDAATGLDHDRLTFSYWIVQPGDAKGEPPAWCRLVSDGLPSDDGPVRICCTPDGLERLPVVSAMRKKARGERWIHDKPQS